MNLKKDIENKSDISEHIVLDIRRILDILPHRYPFILLDRVLEIRDNMELIAIKNVTINEHFFQGHYPDLPVMPGVLQLESMAQAAGVLLLRLANFDDTKVALFMSANRVKFRKAVIPGDTLEIHVKITKIKSNKLAIANCFCMVSKKVVSEAELMFSVTDK